MHFRSAIAKTAACSSAISRPHPDLRQHSNALHSNQQAPETRNSACAGDMSWGLGAYPLQYPGHHNGRTHRKGAP